MSVIVQGVEVYTRDSGHGDPVLFLHGNPDSADTWHEVIARLEPHFRCIAIDLPGFARSKAPAGFDCSIDNLGRFIASLLESLAIDAPVNLVSHDFGGAFAMAFACAHPQKVRRIVTINHPFFVADYRWHAWARIWRAPVIGELSMLAMSWPVFYWSVKRGSRKLGHEQISKMYSYLTPETKRMVLRLYRAAGTAVFAQWERRMLAATAKIPALVLWGEHDPYIPAWVAERFGATRVTRFPGSGHWTPAEVPEEVSAELLAFMAPKPA